MKKLNLILAIIFLASGFSFAQIKGKVTNSKGNLIQFASVSIEKTYIGTSTNENGEFELNIKKPGTYTIITKTLGYKTQKTTKEFNSFPSTINIVLDEEDFTIEAVVVKTSENPANKIIRSAIAARKKNLERTDKFEADFYSRGIFKVKDIPKKFMGIEIGDMGGNLDSLGNGIIYQSETVSKIKFEKPNNLKEEIIASKTAGDSNGLSFNTALDTNFDFYQNNIEFDIPMISPIATNAFTYYKYKLESHFYDNYNNQINKIKVIAKRDKEPVFEGYIYIVEDTWAIYAIDLDAKGYRMQNEFLETLKLTQNFNFNPENKLWVKNLQTIDFKAGIFSMKFNGKFTHVFNNYVFIEKFAKKTFTNEVVTFAEKANKKEDAFWEENRPVPLTEEENTNYIRKDSIFKVRNSQVYSDSIDKKDNKFKLRKLLTGYSYKNSFKKTFFNYSGLFDVGGSSFNTLQGYTIGTGFSYSKFNREEGKSTRISTNFQYGFSDKRIRPTFNFYHKFNNINDWYINASGGVKVQQFNVNEPISEAVNLVASLLFKDNYLKAYNKEYISIGSGKEVVNGLNLGVLFSYENRKPLFNTTNHTYIKKDKPYLSNNPLDYSSDAFSAIDEHHLSKFSLNGSYVFNQKYISRPNNKLNMNDGKYPKLFFNYTKAFASSNKNYEFDKLQLSSTYSKQLGNKGELEFFVKAAKFFNAENISFADYQHFNGNQTHFLSGNTKNSFNLLPYYELSTNKQFFEAHINYNDNGFFMNKIPLINKLGWNLVGGFHNVASPDYKPYQEFSVGLDRIGFGKYKILRVDYVRSFQGGKAGDGFMFGLSF
jgi:hypothetical protein